MTTIERRNDTVLVNDPANVEDFTGYFAREMLASCNGDFVTVSAGDRRVFRELYSDLTIIGHGIPTSAKNAVDILTAFFFGVSFDQYTEDFELKTNDSETTKLLKLQGQTLTNIVQQNQIIIFLLKSIAE